MGDFMACLYTWTLRSKGSHTTSVRCIPYLIILFSIPTGGPIATDCNKITRESTDITREG
ncbi:hypothetical protein SLEP1_g31539 [Rubroshorea leprosula]|uniref:Uncharacterized protein n=1 Tax=Rubroshorea leprosula TaxID=152421 RepID=A0AAV5KAK2_9ROSI|nr:hypothetical protein SLEP1_g31539 [Rubroshorea leprosula]